jgi:hypothetical protein
MPICGQRVPRHAELPSDSASNVRFSRARARPRSWRTHSQRAHASPSRAPSVHAAQRETQCHFTASASRTRCPSCGDTLVTARRVFLGVSALDETRAMRARIAAHSDANPNRSGRILRGTIRRATGCRTALQRAAKPPRTRSPPRPRSSVPIDRRRTFYVMTYRAPGSTRICMTWRGRLICALFRGVGFRLAWLGTGTPSPLS